MARSQSQRAGRAEIGVETSAGDGEADAWHHGTGKGTDWQCVKVEEMLPGLALYWSSVSVLTHPGESCRTLSRIHTVRYVRIMG